jgi:hypothetical protein
MAKTGMDPTQFSKARFLKIDKNWRDPDRAYIYTQSWTLSINITEHISDMPLNPDLGEAQIDI